MNEVIYRAKQAYQEGRYQDALELVNPILDQNPDDAQALFVMGAIFIHTQKRGLAHNLMARCLKFAPDQPEAWINYGRTLNDDVEGWAETEFCMQKALSIKPDSRAAFENLAALELQRCNPRKGLHYCEKALELDSTSAVATSTRGFCHLMLGNWEEGWKDYHTMLGHRSRPVVEYGDLPEWDGSPGKTVIISGEQGIGDELLYAEMLDDVARDCKAVVYDGMERLKPLLQRGRPQNVYVAGQRWADELELPVNITPDARITQAGVGMYYRRSDDDFSGVPYIRADGNIRTSMRAMLDSYGPAPKIGIAWTGGTVHSRQHFRQSTLEALTPILRTPGVDWISLQYKDASAEIAEYKERRNINIHHFPWVTEAKDYELTAGLVSELDLVIAVPTSVTQLAGGLGVPCWVMVPNITGWLFGRDDAKFVWANSVKILRDRPHKEVAEELMGWLHGRAREQNRGE